MDRPKIAVLFGGRSSEYDISLQSAFSVIGHIDAQRYEPVLIGITKEGDWFRYYGDRADILNDRWRQSGALRARRLCAELSCKGAAGVPGARRRAVHAHRRGLSRSARQKRRGRNGAGAVRARGGTGDRLRHARFGAVHGQGPRAQAGGAGRRGHARRGRFLRRGSRPAS